MPWPSSQRLAAVGWIVSGSAGSCSTGSTGNRSASGSHRWSTTVGRRSDQFRRFQNVARIRFLAEAFFPTASARTKNWTGVTRSPYFWFHFFLSFLTKGVTLPGGSQLLVSPNESMPLFPFPLSCPPTSKIPEPRQAYFATLHDGTLARRHGSL